ncbi:UNVERIFIED_CONTAM: hypothetical protein Sangu_2463400 [Sesamum angustifolium]|uniref:Retrotransposon gag domain-containing protein n=1 Tax=Sesamum angustifolium TaxID=2727405 RepID=A0AAW2JL86_9LAMI
MPTKSTQALEEAITALSDRLLELHASMELRHDSLVAELSSWDAFVRALELCFGPSSFDNHQAVLFKLRQQGSVAEFQASPGHSTQARGPPAVIPQPGVWPRSFGGVKTLRQQDVTPPPPPRPLALLAAPPSPPVTSRRLSPAELQERHTKGFCFNCDEKFGPGHRCKAKQFMLLLSDDPPNLFDTCPDSEDVPSSPEAALTDGVLFQLSPAAVSGSSSPYSLLSGLDSRARRFYLN